MDIVIHISLDILNDNQMSEFEREEGGHHHHHHDFGPTYGGGMGFGVRRGEFRFLILIALSEKPMHGYALIQEIGRTYQRPVSAGLVYPTLQELEDMEFVTSKEKEGGKKVYSIASKGRGYLKENDQVVSRLKSGQEYASELGQFGFMNDLRDIQRMLMVNAEFVNTEKMKAIQNVLSETKRKVASIVFG
jgi:DNA-binding PadR family transcriptional regulator